MGRESPKGTEIESILNSVADETALLQHCSAGDWANRSTRHMLPNKRVQLYLHNTLVENNIKNEIQKFSTGTSAEKYIGAKLVLTILNSKP